MNVKVLGDAGYEWAMLGLSLSYAQTMEKATEIAPRLAHKQGGHNKFLESMFVWLDVTLPRGVWQEADTYRLSTKQSASTMHTITKGTLSQQNFELPVYEPSLLHLNSLISQYNAQDTNKDSRELLFMQIKNNLPEGFLQRRIWCMSYKTLQNIYYQRITHKLPQWRLFLYTVTSNISHPEFIIPPEKK